MSWPTAGRSSADRRPSCFSCSVISPFLPRKRTRAASSSGSVVAAVYGRVSTAPARALSRETRFGFFRLGAEGDLVEHGEISKNLAVDLDRGLPQTIHQATVGQAEIACRGVDTHDPQAAEFALAHATIAIGILAGLGHRVGGDAKNVAALTVITLGLIQHFLVTGTCRYTTFHSWHVLNPLNSKIISYAAASGGCRPRPTDAPARCGGDGVSAWSSSWSRYDSCTLARA